VARCPRSPQRSCKSVNWCSQTSRPESSAYHTACGTGGGTEMQGTLRRKGDRDRRAHAANLLNPLCLGRCQRPGNVCRVERDAQLLSCTAKAIDTRPPPLISLLRTLNYLLTLALPGTTPSSLTKCMAKILSYCQCVWDTHARSSVHCNPGTR
jgi:hypothetical protein